MAAILYIVQHEDSELALIMRPKVLAAYAGRKDFLSGRTLVTSVLHVNPAPKTGRNEAWLSRCNCTEADYINDSKWSLLGTLWVAVQEQRLVQTLDYRLFCAYYNWFVVEILVHIEYALHAFCIFVFVRYLDVEICILCIRISVYLYTQYIIPLHKNTCKYLSELFKGDRSGAPRNNGPAKPEQVASTRANSNTWTISRGNHAQLKPTYCIHRDMDQEVRGGISHKTYDLVVREWQTNMLMSCEVVRPRNFSQLQTSPN